MRAQRSPAKRGGYQPAAAVLPAQKRPTLAAASPRPRPAPAAASLATIGPPSASHCSARPISTMARANLTDLMAAPAPARGYPSSRRLPTAVWLGLGAQPGKLGAKGYAVVSVLSACPIAGGAGDFLTPDHLERAETEVTKRTGHMGNTFRPRRRPWEVPMPVPRQCGARAHRCRASAQPVPSSYSGRARPVTRPVTRPVSRPVTPARHVRSC
jgi:hypothetical protein